MPNETGGYIQVRKNDWEDLNRTFRHVWDRMDALEGGRGSTLHKSNINLNGHRVINAADPVDDGDLVNKSYLESVTSPEVLRSELTNGGTAPLNVGQLRGVLAQPQPASVPVVSTLPPITTSLQGELAYFASALYIFDRSSDPGSWVPVGGSPNRVLNDSATNTVSTIFTTTHTSTGTVAAGFGSSLLYELENDAGTTVSAGTIDALWISAADAAETSALAINLKTAGGALAEALRITSGQVLIGAATTEIGAVGARVVVTGTGRGFFIQESTVNTAYGSLSLSSGNYVALSSLKTGSGTALPLAFFVAGTELARIAVDNKLVFTSTSTAAVSSSAQAALRNNAGVLEVSNDGADWLPVGTSTSAGGWQDDGTVVRLIAPTDVVGIGVSSIADATQTAVEMFKSSSTGAWSVLWNDDTGATGYAAYIVRSGSGSSTRAIHIGVTSSGFSTASGLSASQAFITTGDDATNGLVIQTAAGGVTFQTGGSTQKMVIGSGGQILIGTSTTDLATPLAIVNGVGIGVAHQAADSAFIGISVLAGNYASLHSLKTGSGTALPLAIFVAAAERGRFTTDGQLFIGATSTEIGSAGPRVIVTGTANGFFIQEATTNTAYGALTLSSGNYVALNSLKTGSGTALPLAFFVAGAETGRFTTDGQLFVGATSTEIGSAGARVIVTGTAKGFFIQESTTNTAYGALTLSSGNYVALNSLKTGSGTALPLAFFVAGAETGRFTTDGQLLIGATSTDIGAAGPRIIVFGTAHGFFIQESAADSAYGALTLSSGNYVTLSSLKTGSGTALPLAFFVNAAERMRILTNGRVGIGTTAPSSIFNVVGADSGNTIVDIEQSGTGDTNYVRFRRSRGTASSRSATQSGDALGIFAAMGYGDTVYSYSAFIRFVASENFTNSAFGGAIQFYTTPVGSTSTAERVRIDDAGQVLVGSTTTEIGSPSARVIVTGTGRGFFIQEATTNTAYGALTLSSGNYVSLSSLKTGSGTALPLAFFVAGSEIIRVTTTGRVGIGIATPSGPFQVKAATDKNLLVTANISIPTAVSLNAINDAGGANVPLEIRSSLTGFTAGDIFIADGLQVFVGASATEIGAAGSRVVVTGTGRGFFIQEATTNTAYGALTLSSGNYVSLSSLKTGSGTALPLAFFVAGSEIMRITTGGNVGIGTTTPGNNLSIRTAGGGGSITASTANSAIRIIDTNTGVGSRRGISWERGDSATTTIAAIQVEVASGWLSDLTFFTNTDGSTAFTEKARITADGQVLVGAISTEIGSPGSRVIVTGTARGFFIQEATTNTAYGALTLSSGNYVSLSSLKTGSGTALPLAFFVNGSERARFQTDGRLLVGLTSSDLTSVTTQIVIDGSSGGGVYVVRSSTNAHVGSITTSATAVNINSTITGSGTQRPLRIFAFGEQCAEFDGSDSSTQTSMSIRQNGSSKRVKIINDGTYGGGGNRLLLYVDA